MYWPDLDPLPVMTLTTPAGTTSPMSCMSTRSESGVDEDDLMTEQSPAARTGASFQAAMRKGKFHGTI